MDVAIVKVENLSHRYSSQWAIQDISFEINQTGVLGLLGSNGAGKSTTMNIMCGVLKQTKGEVYINGVSLRDNPVEAKKHIGFLPQKPPLHLDLNVDEYLTHCAYLRSVEPKHIKAAVEKAKDKCGIMHFSKRLVRNLSGGYQQRLGIAQAIVHDPKFVVLDEPTNGLDPNQIVEIRNLVKEIAVDRAVMLSTHILPEVQMTCDQIRMIESGHMVFAGTMDEFNNYIKPDSLVVLMDAPPSENELRAIPGIVGVENLTNKRFRLHFDTMDAISEKVIEASVANG
ncbi:ABC transporter ATP-binding protein, partial [Butyricimonas faecihominis]